MNLMEKLTETGDNLDDHDPECGDTDPISNNTIQILIVSLLKFTECS